MNEYKSLKLYKSHKIVCFIVCFVIVLSMLSVSAFADDTVSAHDEAQVLIRAGTYIWNDNIAPISTDFIIEPLPFTTPPLDIPDYSLGTWDILSVVILDNETVIGYGSTLNKIEIGVYSDTYGWDYANNSISGLVPSGYGKSLTILENTLVSADFGHYFLSNTTYLDEYDGNPWVDILNGVLDAIDVNIFGTFSYLDIVSTLAGACLAIWLLKMLAGG